MKPAGTNPGKRLSHTNLKIGDIILSTSNEMVSGIVRGRTKSDISHAMVYTGGGTITHADREGVHIALLSDIDIPYNRVIYVKRLIRKFTSIENLYLQIFLRKQVGHAYSIPEAISADPKFGKSEEDGFSREQFCSRLVAQAYEHVGIELVQRTNYCTPNDLKLSSLLVDVTPECTSDKYIDGLFESRIRNFTVNETSALTGIRKIAGSSIQNIEDLVEFIVCNPAPASEIHRFMLDIGYLRASNYYDETKRWQWERVAVVNSVDDVDVMKEYFKKSRMHDWVNSALYAKRSVRITDLMRAITKKPGYEAAFNLLDDIREIHNQHSLIGSDSLWNSEDIFGYLPWDEMHEENNIFVQALEDPSDLVVGR